MHRHDELTHFLILTFLIGQLLFNFLLIIVFLKYNSVDPIILITLKITLNLEPDCTLSYSSSILLPIFEKQYFVPPDDFSQWSTKILETFGLVPKPRNRRVLPFCVLQRMAV